MLTAPAQSSPADRNRNMEKWIKEIATLDREALAHLYDDTHTDVYGFALSILKNRQDAEDVLQDVYVKIWQSAPAYKPCGKPLAWIFTITRNLALMNIRRQNRTVPLDPQECQEEIREDEGTVDAEEKMILSSLMGSLDDDERQIIVLHAVSGMKHREIADLLGVGISTVISRYNRALKKLRMAMEEAK